MVACPARANSTSTWCQDDALTPEQIERIVDHVETCPSCQELLDGMTENEIPGHNDAVAAGLSRFTSTWGPGHSARSGWPRT